MIDLTALTDAEFEQLRREVVAEIDRREALRSIPDQITEMANRFRAIGGDPARLSLPAPTSDDGEQVEEPVDVVGAVDDVDVHTDQG